MKFYFLLFFLLIFNIYCAEHKSETSISNQRKLVISTENKTCTKKDTSSFDVEFYFEQLKREEAADYENDEVHYNNEDYLEDDYGIEGDYYAENVANNYSKEDVKLLYSLIIDDNFGYDLSEPIDFISSKQMESILYEYTGFFNSLFDAISFKKFSEIKNQKNLYEEGNYFESFLGYSPWYTDYETNLPFSCYRPEAVEWIRENMLLPPDTKIQGLAYQMIYDKAFNLFFRIGYRTLNHLIENDFMQHAIDYMNTSEYYTCDELDYLESKYNTVFPEYYDEEIIACGGLEHSYLNTHIAIGFWLRRFVDGSIIEFAHILTDVLQTYDNEWFVANSKKENWQTFVNLIKSEEYKSKEKHYWVEDTHPWEIEDEYIIGYKGDKYMIDTLIIPENFGKIEIIGIKADPESGDGMFRYCNIKHLVLPNTIKCIEKDAFRGNQLSSVKIPDSLQIISKGLFAENDIDSIIITKNSKLENIGAEAFFDNKISFFNIPKNVSEIGEMAFHANQIKQLYIHKNIKHIKERAFGTNQIEKVKFAPECQLKEISTMTFSFNNINRIDIPGSIKTIGKNAFYFNNLDTIAIQDNKEIQLDSFYISTRSTNIFIDTNIGDIGLEENQDKMNDIKYWKTPSGKKIEEGEQCNERGMYIAVHKKTIRKK